MIPKFSIPAFLLIFLLPVYVYAVPGTIPVDIDGTTVDINYDAEGVVINSVEADLSEAALLFQVEITGPHGILELTFDRDFFDSKIDGQDDIFIVLAEGELIIPEDVETTSESRTLLIEIPTFANDPEVDLEIYGTVLAGVTFGEEPPVEEPEVEEPPVEAPEIEEPEVEEPPVEAPPVEEPKVEEPPVEEPETEVMPEKPQIECGPGTHLEDGTCILDTKAPSTGPKIPPMSEFVVAGIGAFIIALGVSTILWIISRGSRSKQKSTSY